MKNVKCQMHGKIIHLRILKVFQTKIAQLADLIPQRILTGLQFSRRMSLQNLCFYCVHFSFFGCMQPASFCHLYILTSVSRRDSFNAELARQSHYYYEVAILFCALSKKLKQDPTFLQTLKNTQ